MQFIKNKKGMTLIELLIASLITVVVIGGLVNMMLSFKTRYDECVTLTESEGQTQNILDVISRDAKIAETIENIYGVYASSSNTLILKMNSMDASGDILNYSVNYDYIIYRVNPSDASELQRIVAADAASSRVSETVLISDILSGITFTYDNPDFASSTSISVAIDLSDTGGADRCLTKSATTKITLRSKS